MEPYKYAPLKYRDSTRLIILFPGDRCTDIKIGLFEARLGDNLRYDALSYTWASENGGDDRVVPVSCNAKSIRVTENCAAALRRLGRRAVSRPLWVDAICIDQENVEERGQQVAIMDDIYSKAKEVLIWLGEASSDVDEETFEPVSDIFLEYLEPMVNEFRQKKFKTAMEATAAPLYRNLVGEVYSLMIGRNSRGTPLARGFLDIQNRHWWQRIWVLQEVILARSATFICGEKLGSHEKYFAFSSLLTNDESREGRHLVHYVSRTIEHIAMYSFAAVSYPRLTGPFSRENTKRLSISSSQRSTRQDFRHSWFC